MFALIFLAFFFFFAIACGLIKLFFSLIFKLFKVAFSMLLFIITPIFYGLVFAICLPFIIIAIFFTFIKNCLIGKKSTA